jgi:hypothetical protein
VREKFKARDENEQMEMDCGEWHEFVTKIKHLFLNKHSKIFKSF